MKHAIVTGATGFVGIHLVNELLKNGVEVTALCRKGSPNLSRLPEGVSVVFDYDNLPRADALYHLAWEQASGPGRGDAALQTRNAELALEAINAAHRLDARFVALGTVYERFAGAVVRSDKFGGSDFYILAKSFAHAMCDKLAYKLGVDFTWCEICHPIGRYIKPEQLMAFTVSELLRGNPPSFGPAEILYDIVAVEDASRGLFLAGMPESRRREYFIGSGAPRKLREYLNDTRRILGVETPLLIGQRPDDGLRFERDWFDISPLTEDAGYYPSISFEMAVRNVAEWVSRQ